MTVEAPERPIADLAIAPRQEREVRLGTLSRAVTQSTHTLVMEIAAALSDGGLVGDSSADMRAWLVHNLGHSQATARGLVALAERIGELPRTCTYLEAGAISVDAAIVIARHGATECEAELAELACDVTTSELTRFAKDAKPEPEAHTLDENEYIKEITWFRDEREGWWWINGRLPLADGAVVETALRRIMGGLVSKNEIGQYYPHGMQAAEALVELAGTSLDNDRDPDRATVVLHITQPTSPEERQLTLIENGPAIPTASAHRLTCDARCQVVMHLPDGTIIGVGRTTRVIPMWLRRVVRGRDRGCRFPGCDRTEHLQIHHIWHWSRGGPTDLDNLITLCGRHHRFLHEHGWGIAGTPDDPVFEKSPGQPYTPIRKLLTKDPPWWDEPLLTPREILVPDPLRT